MATTLTFTIGPSGADYTTLSAAVVANAKNLVTADEQHIYEFWSFPSGLNDNTAFVGYTTDATRNIIITVRATDRRTLLSDPTTGFYFNLTGSTNAIRPISTCNHITVEHVGFLGGRWIPTNNSGFANGLITDCCVKNQSSSLSISNGSLTIQDTYIIDSSGDGLLFTAASATARDLVVVGSGSRGVVSTNGTLNNLIISGSSSVDYSNQGGTIDYIVTEDSTAPGSNSQPSTSFTNAYVDSGAGNYLIQSGFSSANLVGQGVGGSDIVDFAYEPSAGITVTGATPSYSYTAVNGTVDLTGAIDITGATATYSYTAVSGVVDLTAEITVTGATPSYSYTAVNGVIELGQEINVVGATPSYSYTAVQGSVLLQGEIAITGQTPNYSYTAISASVQVGELDFAVNFSGLIKQSTFKGSIKSPEFTGTVKSATFSGNIKQSNFSGVRK